MGVVVTSIKLILFVVMLLLPTTSEHTTNNNLSIIFYILRLLRFFDGALPGAVASTMFLNFNCIPFFLFNITHTVCRAGIDCWSHSHQLYADT